MFNKKEAPGKDACNTLVGVNTTIEGNIVSEGTLRVDGKVKGDIRVNGDIFVGNDAVITGNINAGNINISGTIEGNVETSGFLRLLPTARLYGDIQVHSFITDEGAIFQGKCNMIDMPSQEKAGEKPSGKKSGKDYKKSSVLDQVYEETNTKMDA